MYSYALSGSQAPKQNLLWQDRRGSSQLPDRQQGEHWWRKIKKSITATEPPEIVPTKVFSREKGVLSGRAIMSLPGPDRVPDQQLFNLETLEEGPTRPQLNLGDISSQFSPLISDRTNQTKPTLPAAPVLPELPQTRKPPPAPPVASLPPLKVLHQIPLVDTPKKQLDLVTASETEIINPPSPFLDQSRRRPPPVPRDSHESILSEEKQRNLSGATRPQRSINIPPIDTEQGRGPQRSINSPPIDTEQGRGPQRSINSPPIDTEQGRGPQRSINIPPIDTEQGRGPQRSINSPPIDTEQGRGPQRSINSPPIDTEQGRGPQRSHFVREAVSIFEKNSPALKQSPEFSENFISVKIPNKVANTRQRSKGPSRTPSELDLSRQATPTSTDAGDIGAQLASTKNRLSKSYDLATEQEEAPLPRDRSFSDTGSLDSKLDSLEPQAKEKKSSVLRGLINATRSKITLDTKDQDREKSNTDPSRRRVRRSSSVKPVKSETSMEIATKPAESDTSSFRGKRSKRKPRHFELQGGFNVKGFDNFMMY